jgi:hypothetical protein
MGAVVENAAGSKEVVEVSSFLKVIEVIQWACWASPQGQEHDV